MLGVAALWSIETFVFCAAAYAGMALLEAAGGATSPRELAGRFVRGLAPGATAVVAAHVLFALATVAGRGALPDWPTYLGFFDSYDANGIAAYSIQPWSPGLAVSAAYLASLAGVATLAQRAPRLVREERLAMLAIAGMASFGFVSFAYFIGNSIPSVAVPLAPPCIATTALWLVVLERQRRRAPGILRIGAPALAFVVAALLGVFTFPPVKLHARDTPLALALPDGGGSLPTELGRMWRSEPVSSRYTRAAALVRQATPGSDRALVLTANGNTVGVLLQSGRANVLPVSQFLQDGLVVDRVWPRVRRAVDRLPPGTPMLTEPRIENRLGGHPAPLLQRTSQRIRARFRLQFVAGDPKGFHVVRLQPRHPAPG